MNLTKKIMFASAIILSGVVGGGVAFALSPVAAVPVRPLPARIVVKQLTGPLLPSGTAVTIACPPSAPSLPTLVSSDSMWTGMIGVPGALVETSAENDNQGGFVLECDYAVVPEVSTPVPIDLSKQGLLAFWQGIDPKLGNCKQGPAGFQGPAVCYVK